MPVCALSQVSGCLRRPDEGAPKHSAQASSCSAGLTRMHNFTVACTGRRANGALTLQDNHLSA